MIRKNVDSVNVDPVNYFRKAGHAENAAHASSHHICAYVVAPISKLFKSGVLNTFLVTSPFLFPPHAINFRI